MKKTLLILCALVCGTLAFAQTYTGTLHVWVDGEDDGSVESSIMVAFDEEDNSKLDFTLHDFAISIGSLDLDLGDITVNGVDVTEGTDGVATISCTDDHDVTFDSSLSSLVSDISVEMSGTISEEDLIANMTISVDVGLGSILSLGSYTITATFASSGYGLNGDYLIVNAESGYYLAGGLGWGTCAMEGGKPQFMTLEAQGDGTYTIDSHQTNGGNYHYLGTNRYMDNLAIGWKIEEVDGGYTLYYNGTSDNVTFTGYLTGAGFQTQVVAETTPTANSVWKLVSRDDVIASMADATVNDPVDVSALIPSCEPKRNAWGDVQITGVWTATGYNVAAVPANYSFGQDGNVASVCESYHSTNGFDFHQTVNFPKAGYYILSSQAFYRSDAANWGSTIDNTHVATMYAGDNSVQIYRSDVSNNISDYTPMANAYQDLLDGLHPLSLCLYIAEDDTEMEVGFRSNYAQSDEKWTIFGELGLQYLGNDSYESFVVHEAEAAVDDWSITSGGTLDYNFWSSEEDESEMVVPFMQYWVGSGSTLAAATISHSTLTELYPGMYEVSLDIRVLNENANRKVTEGTLFKANNASEDLVTGTDSHDGTYGNNDDDVYGTYTLTCVVDGNGTLDISIVIPDGVTYNWIAFKNLKVTYLGDLSVDWTMTEAEWGTLILPFAADVPDGLTAYTIGSVTTDDTNDDIAATLSLTASDAIAANTPYIMGGTENTYTFTGTPTNEKDSYSSDAVNGASLTGTLVDMSLAKGDFTTDGNQYVLQNHTETGGGGLAFYPITSESATTGVTLDAYHCYLTYSNASGVKGFISFAGTDDEATAIVAVESAEAEGNGAIYDLSGRKVSKAVKGVYIQNGKKVLVK